MALSHSPKIITEGLAFYYDMANSNKSWKGAPTTNIVAASYDVTFESTAEGNTSGFANQLGTGNFLGVASGRGYNSNKSLRINRGTGGTGRAYRTYSVSLGEFSTVSAWVWSDVAGPFIAIEYFGGNYSWGVDQTRNTHTGTGWERLWVKTSSSATSATTAYYFFYPSVENKDTFWDDIQVEKQAFATPFVNGTRSNTQAILDLTNNNTITANSLTYAADGTFSFSAANFSNLSIPDSSNIRFPHNSQWSIQLIFKVTSFVGSFPGIFIKGSSGGSGVIVYYTSGGSLVFKHNNSQTTIASYTLNQYMVLTITFDGTTVRAYKNGVYSANGVSMVSTDSTSSLQIGRADQYGDQYIDSVSIYNRALTAAEVQQNFQALRGRYGI